MPCASSMLRCLTPLPRVDLSLILPGLLIPNSAAGVAKTPSALWKLFPLAHLCSVQAWELSAWHQLSSLWAGNSTMCQGRWEETHSIWEFRGGKNTSRCVFKYPSSWMYLIVNVHTFLPRTITSLIRILTMSSREGHGEQQEKEEIRVLPLPFKIS